MTDRKQDIVERLRDAGSCVFFEAAALDLQHEAASEIERLREAVTVAADTFTHYGELHRAKGIEGQSKAEANERLAAAMLYALAPPCPSAPGSVE